MEQAGVETDQSSTGWGGDAIRAIDGNTSGKYGDKSCTHTKNEKEGPAWWRATLPGQYFIEAIEVFNREDCCSDRLKDFQVYIGNHENYLENEACEDGKLYSGAGEIKCQLSGQYIVIAK